jgi:glucokinase
VTWLGIDIGGSKTVVAVADADGRVRARRRRPSDLSGDPGRDLERIVADCRAVLDEAGCSVRGVGVSAPGPIDPERGAIVSPPNLLGWVDVPLRDELARALDLPVWLENDANAAALAEWRFGAGQGCQDLVYLTMSTGIGAGLVLGGRLHRGVSGNAGEVGHVPVEWDGAPCACGRRGCFEAYAGGAAWSARLRREVPAASRVVALAGAREAVTPEHVVAAAREGDAYARAELERFNSWLVRGLVGIVFVLAPQVIVLGTIPSAAGEALCLEPVRTGVRARVWPLLAEGLRIEAAALGERLPELAGLCVALEAERAAGSLPSA